MYIPPVFFWKRSFNSILDCHSSYSVSFSLTLHIGHDLHLFFLYLLILLKIEIIEKTDVDAYSVEWIFVYAFLIFFSIILLTFVHGADETAFASDHNFTRHNWNIQSTCCRIWSKSFMSMFYGHCSLWKICRVKY